MKHFSLHSTLLTGAFLALFSGFFCSTAHAQAYAITLDTPTVGFGTLTQADLDAGFKDITASSSTYALRVNVANPNKKAWSLYTSASTANFNAAAGIKPAGALQWRINGTGGYTAYTTTNVLTANGTTDSTVDFDFRMLTGWTDTPDTYSLTVVFTITQP